jgi:hypothetical protein
MSAERCDNQRIQLVYLVSDSGRKGAEVQEQHPYRDVYADNFGDERDFEEKRRDHDYERPRRDFYP